MSLELKDVKDALDEAGKVYHGQFTRLNQEIAELKAAGKTPDPLMLELRDRLNTAIDEQSQKNEQFMAAKAAVDRLAALGLPEPGKGDIAAETRAFNLLVRSNAALQGKPAPAEVSPDQVRAYKAAFDRYLHVGEKGLTPEEHRAMSVGSDVNGGYLVDPDRTGAMVKKVFETSDVRRFAAAQTISTDALEGSADLDEASGGWVSETGSRSD